jgi:hypothetical protein
VLKVISVNAITETLARTRRLHPDGAASLAQRRRDTTDRTRSLAPCCETISTGSTVRHR